MNTQDNSMVDSRELHRLRTFYLGQPGTGDLRTAFTIDGRDYTNPGRVRADIAAAVRELHQRRLAAQMFTEPVTADSPRPLAPTWPQWKATRHAESTSRPGRSPQPLHRNGARRG